MLDGLLQWYQRTTDVTPLAEGKIFKAHLDSVQPFLWSPATLSFPWYMPCCADTVGYPANHSSRPPDEELWWQRFNPVLHTQYQTMTVDGHPLEGEH